MKVAGFYIEDKGDSSVGLSPQTWQLKGLIDFEDKEEVDIFRELLRELFELFSTGKPNVTTFEEHIEEIKMENEMLGEQNDK